VIKLGRGVVVLFVADKNRGRRRNGKMEREGLLIRS
jgi:hypothetical protein